MSDQMPQVDKWILSPPGGPAGSFWGIVTQSGRVIALQILEREHAEILLTVGNLLAGDPDTTRIVSKELLTILNRDVPSQFSGFRVGSEVYLVSAAVEAILEVVKESNE